MDINVGLRAIGAGVALFGALCAAPTAALNIGDRVENFRLMDHTSGSTELYYYSDVKAVVLMAHNSSCEQVAASAQGITQMRDQHASDELKVMWINSDLRDQREHVEASAARLSLQAPVLLDSTQIIGESLSMQQAGEPPHLLPDRQSSRSQEFGKQ